MARPRSNSAWACGVHETGKLTLPSFSSLDTRAGVVEKATDSTVKARATRVTLVFGRFMSVSSSLETVGKRLGHTRSERVASQGSLLSLQRERSRVAPAHNGKAEVAGPFLGELRRPAVGWKPRRAGGAREPPPEHGQRLREPTADLGLPADRRHPVEPPHAGGNWRRPPGDPQGRKILGRHRAGPMPPHALLSVATAVATERRGLPRVEPGRGAQVLHGQAAVEESPEARRPVVSSRRGPDAAGGLRGVQAALGDIPHGLL